MQNNKGKATYLASTLRGILVFSIAAENDKALLSECTCLLYRFVNHWCDHATYVYDSCWQVLLNAVPY